MLRNQRDGGRTPSHACPTSAAWRVLFVGVVGLALLALAPSVAAGAAGGDVVGGDAEIPADEDAVIVDVHDLDDGTATVTHEFHLSGDVTSIEVEYSERDPLFGEIGDVSGFESTDDDLAFEWERSDDDPSTTVLSVTTALDETAAQAYADDDERLLYGQLWYDGTVRGSGSIGVDYRSELAAGTDGAVTDYYTYLGPAERYETHVDGTTIELVVPDEESNALAETPDEILEAYADAATRFDPAGESDRADEVSMDEISVLTPSSTIGSNGRAHVGGQSAWVQPDRPLDAPTSTWLHEYVHLQQNFDVETDFQWFVEGSADYYAAVLAVNQLRAPVDEAVEALEAGDASGQLTDPESWDGPLDYDHGDRTAAAVDAEIRRATDHERSLADVWVRLVDHDGAVDHDAFVGHVEAVAGAEAAAQVDAYVRGEETATVPTDPAFYTLPVGEEAPATWDDVEATGVEISSGAAETAADPGGETAGDAPEASPGELAMDGLAALWVDLGSALGLGAFSVGVVAGWANVVGSVRSGRPIHSTLLGLLFLGAMTLLVAAVPDVAIAAVP